VDETRLARVRELLGKRDEIDVELDAMFSGTPVPKRKWTRRQNGAEQEAGQTETA
jgi:hypothetical protein